MKAVYLFFLPLLSCGFLSGSPKSVDGGGSLDQCHWISDKGQISLTGISEAVGFASGWPLACPWRFCSFLFLVGLAQGDLLHSIDRRVGVLDLSDIPEKLILLQGWVNHMAA